MFSMTNFHMDIDFSFLGMHGMQAESMRKWGLLLAAFFCAVLPLEISHLVSAIVGALGYLLLQTLQPSVERKPPKAAKAGVSAKMAVASSRAYPAVPGGQRRVATRQGTTGASAPNRGSGRDAAVGPRLPEVRKPSVAPVSAPTFQAVGWDAEVEELLQRILPTPEGDSVVAEIAEKVRRAIRSSVPEAEVSGYASGNILGRSAFGVAVPEVDIVVSVNATALQGRLHGRWGADVRSPTGRLDSRKLQKSAIRVCTDRLVGAGGFKFRRSAFRGNEPKVTLIAPTSMGGDGEQGVPVNLSVNAMTPLYSATVLAECKKIDPRAAALILVVKRWAKDRGVSHAAKGHLSPYTWSLMAIYFLQVASREEGPLLPPLDGRACANGLTMRSQGGKSGAAAPQAEEGAAKKSVGDLFTDFIKFYAAEFDWHKEAVSVLTGRRSPPDIALPLHIILHEDGVTTEVGPSIEDPFELATNVGACTTQNSMARLREELERAVRLCSGGACLTELLEPWAPPASAENDEE